MDPDSQLRNLRDFLLVYNRMTEICFQRCSSNFNYRSLTMDESRCVDSCAGKLIRSNHRLMATYSQLMPRMVQRRMEEMESRAAAVEQQAAAEQAAPPVAEASETTVAMATPTPPPATDFGPEAADAVSLPTGFNAPVELQAAPAVSTATDGSPPSTGGPPLPP